MSDTALINQSSAAKMQAPGTVSRVVSSPAVPAPVEVVVQSTDASSVSVASDPASVIAPKKEEQLVDFVQSAPVQANVQAISDPVQPTVQPVSPSVSTPLSVSPHKEAGPVSIEVPGPELSKPVEVIQPSHPEVSVPAEVQEILAPSEASKPFELDKAVT